MNSSHLEMVRRAESLASKLVSGENPVGRNALLSLLGDFMNQRDPNPEQLARTLELVEKGVGGHALWGKGYPEQVKKASAVIRSALGEGLSTEELKSLFGWTARLLLTHERVRNPQDNDNHPSNEDPPRGSRSSGNPSGAKLSDAADPEVRRMLEQMGKKKPHS